MAYWRNLEALEMEQFRELKRHMLALDIEECSFFYNKQEISLHYQVAFAEAAERRDNRRALIAAITTVIDNKRNQS